MFLVGNQRHYTPKLKLLYTAFVHSIKLCEYRIGTKFDEDPLVVEQNYLNKVVNVYIVYDLGLNPTGRDIFGNFG